MPRLHRPREPRTGARRPERPVDVTGTLRWIEPDGSVAAVLVRGSGPLVGETITLDLTQTSVRVADRNLDGRLDARDLLPGDHVSLKLRLPLVTDVVAPRRLVAEAP
jgi:hypothetical protein